MAKFNVLLFESIHEKGLNHLQENDCKITFAPGFDPAQIQSAVQGVDAILARAQGTIDGAVMDAASNLKIIGRHGIGVDNIDIPAATERGILVVNTPNGPVEAVAEYVAMSLVALPRRIVQANHAVRNNDWAFRNRHHGPELRGRTLGIVGFGRIGRRIAEICGLGFGMHVLYSDVAAVAPEEEQRLGVKRVPLDELLSTSDFITLNVPFLKETHHLINAATLQLMKPEAYLVNCSRGPVVDEPALVHALKNGDIAGAVIDVYEKEPVAPDNPLLALDNVLLSPHCSGHSTESAQNLSMVAADIVRVLNGQKPEFPVNHPENPRQKVV
ncbi:MAG: hydroxyacid dehydrogenase [bacterium]|nr:hydroxyacid dehydrogenase [bacterium]